MRRLLIVATALPAALTGCVRYGCAELTLWDTTFEEQCGPAASQGSLYFEDEMVTLIIGADFEDFLTEESSVALDYLPSVRLSFRTEHLTEGTSLAEDQIAVRCGRVEQGGYASWSGQATLDVVEPSNDTQVGGQSWRFRWVAGCDPAAGITTHGDDIIELFIVEQGYDFQLWGIPGDWPT